MIDAVSFDLWDTVFVDDSDEKERAKRGLKTKPEERRDIVCRFLEKTDPVSREDVAVAYDTVDAAFRHVWYQRNVTWTVGERLTVLLQGLKRDLPSAAFDEMVRLHEEMELEIKPALAPGIKDAIIALRSRYKLAVISDAIFSPGRVLKAILEHYDLLRYFDAFVFSDEVGCAKPDPKLFHLIGTQLQIPLDRVVHIGDREEKDIAGPQAVHAKAVLTTVVKDRGGAETKADAVCRDYAALPEIISSLS